MNDCFLLIRFFGLTCAVAGLLFACPSAFADGADTGDSGAATFIDANAMSESNHQTQERTSAQILNWRDWSSPYRYEENLCRESNGNLVCLSLESSRKMRWDED